MNDTKQSISIYKLAKAFEKMSKGFSGKSKEELAIIEQQEMSKIIPSENSEVYMVADYDNDENSIGLSIYVSNPLEKKQIKEIHFNKIMFEYLLRADINKLKNIMECIDLMENKGKDNYSIDGIPVFYSKKTDDYYFQIRITKEL